MNITIISLRGPTNQNLKGGAREYVRKLSIPWLNAGHKITLLCGQEGNDLPEKEVVDGINVIRIGKSKIALFCLWLYYFRYLKKTTDIVVENMVSFPLLMPIIEKTNPVVTVIHHLTGKGYFKTQNIIKAIIGYFLESRVLPVVYKNTNIITVSDLTKQELITIGLPRNKIDIIEPGIDNKFFVPGDKAPTPLIFYVGRYDGVKGVKKVDHLIKAFRMIYKEVPNSSLLIAGPKTGVDELKDLAKDLPVHFIGFISEDQKKEYLQKAWVFASPSLKEGFGITFVEANACGTPVIGYEIKGLKTVDDNSGLFVESGNINHLASALKSILLNNHLRENMQYAAVKNASQYTWEMFTLKSKQYLKEKMEVLRLQN